MAYLRKVYVRFREGVPDNPNAYAAYDGFRQLGVEITPFEGPGDVERMEDLGPEVGVVGFVGDVLSALDKAGRPRPEPIDYPEEILPWLCRKVWRSTLGEVRASTGHVFVKPVRHKLFTGFVWTASRQDRMRLAPYNNDDEVWVSEVVEFVSEYRCFVHDEALVGVRHYKGDWFTALSYSAVGSAVIKFRSAPRAYSLDFGVTKGGQTILVEANDSFALGSYGLQSVLYARMIEARWSELMGE